MNTLSQITARQALELAPKHLVVRSVGPRDLTIAQTLAATDAETLAALETPAMVIPVYGTQDKAVKAVENDRETEKILFVYGPADSIAGAIAFKQAELKAAQEAPAADTYEGRAEQAQIIEQIISELEELESEDEA